MALVHSDVVSPIPVTGYQGSRFFVTFIYDKTRLTIVYYIKTKKEVINYFIYFKKHFERLDLGQTVRRLRDDNSGEYIAGKLQRTFYQEGILWEATEPYFAPINGASERLGQTIQYKAAPLLKFAGLFFKYQPKAIKHTCYLYNRSIHSVLYMSLYKARYSRKPRYSHINMFSCTIYYNNPGQKQKLRD